ncbi:MAG: hypothetical protein CO035_02005 [Candidatus Omnitrophica bacterium CG_4_9_14_0_2_um_filter_42_8]|nr:MAG: hypothetical protein COW92_05665 [Candidatus Omnitrophica bacterium CG22_combo_CG10-13_8_21_14_all_43_16]PJC48715.1 MAG: hypothetical protein CO035_02005 [Candidatus Omnitrophica bacterium CG_4_9_14_0_2_um_filter_42_8]
MVKKIIFNVVIIIILVMIGAAIIKANKPTPGALKSALSNIEKPGSNLNPKEAKYYRVIEE